MTFKELNDLLAQRAEQLCAILLPNGKRQGREWVAGSTEGDAGHSLKAVLEGPKAGRWKDFAKDEGGDLLKLIELVKGTDAKGAADYARDFLGLAPWKADTNTPPPFDPLRFGFKRREETEWRYPAAAWAYTDTTGMPMAWVARFNNADGSKDVLPIRMVDGKPKWKGYTGTEKRPLYNLGKLHSHPDRPVLVVEGEKTADAAAKLFAEWVVTTWMGGTANVRKADWTILIERRTQVVLWADADEPGRKAMAYLAQLIPGAKRVATTELPAKWDLADPLPEGIVPQAMVDRALAVDPVAEAKAKEAAKKEAEEGEERYHLPPGCELSKVEGDILRYGVFEHRNQVFTLYNDRGIKGKWATEVSNCTVNIHRHIKAKDGAIALVTIANNAHPQQVVTVDVPFKSFGSERSFTDLLGDHGNFQWWGAASSFIGYKRLLMDRMKRCELITELGGHPAGFFTFNNAMVNGSVTRMDKDGCFEHEGQWYYVPSANVAYAEMPEEYAIQKHLVLSDNVIDFATWNAQYVRVFKEHAYMATAFVLMTAFSGHVFKCVEGVPVMFYQGPGGGGKDRIIKGAQAVFGVPLPEIFLSGPNTDKGLIKMTAEATDVIVNMAEYRKGYRGGKDSDELLKSMWGRIGYRIAAMRGKKTEMIRPTCTAMVSANDMPSDNALIRRLMIEVVEKRHKTDDDVAEFLRFQDMQKAGYSNILTEFYRFRPDYLRNWYSDYYKPSRSVMLEALAGVEIDTAILPNMQVLYSTMRFFQDKGLKFAFHPDDLAGHMGQCMKRQLEIRSEGSEVAAWWTCFVHAARKGALIEGRDFKLIGHTIVFYFAAIYPAYAEAHQRVFGDRAERPTDMRAKLERHKCYMETSKSSRIGHKNSSAMVCDMNETGTNLRQLLTGSESVFDGADTGDGTLPF